MKDRPTATKPEKSSSQVNDVDYLSREEALGILGIKKESLYTYASRGLIRTLSEPGKKTSLYRKSDVEKLKTRASAKSGGQRVAQVLRYGEPVVQTWICDITDAGPRYRGQLATSLVRDGRSFEFTAELIWGGLPPARDLPWPEILENTDLVGLQAALGNGEKPFSPLRAFSHIALQLSSLEAADDRAQHMDARACGIRLLSAFAGVAGYLGPCQAYQPQGKQQFISQRLLAGLGLVEHPEADKVLQALTAALILSVDNELSPPTFATRISSSTGVDLFACVVSALMAQAGPMQVGGATHLEAFLQAVLKSPRKTRAAGPDIPCFDHPLYDKDPRAELLIAYVAGFKDALPVRSALLRFVDQTYEETGRYPNLFAALVILSMSLGLPQGSAAFLHTLGRSAGWIAHAAEQRLTGTMLRPRARYMGAVTL